MKAIFFLLLTLASFSLFYPPAPFPLTLTVTVPGEVYPCGDERVFRLTITNTADSTLTDIDITYLFADGLQYVPQSVSGAGVSELNVTDLARPEFLVPQIAAFGAVEVEFRARATCQVKEGTRKDIVIVTCNGES